MCPDNSHSGICGFSFSNLLILCFWFLRVSEMDYCILLLHLFYLSLKVKVAQLCLTLWDTMDYTVHGLLQARILEWVAFPFSRGSSQPREWTQVSCIAGKFFTSWAAREAIWAYLMGFCFVLIPCHQRINVSDLDIGGELTPGTKANSYVLTIFLIRIIWPYRSRKMPSFHSSPVTDGLPSRSFCIISLEIFKGGFHALEFWVVSFLSQEMFRMRLIDCLEEMCRRQMEIPKRCLNKITSTPNLQFLGSPWPLRSDCMCVCAQSCPALCDPMGHNPLPGSLSMECSRQKYWSRLPFPTPGNLPGPGIEPMSPTSRVLYHWHHLGSPFVRLQVPNLLSFPYNHLPMFSPHLDVLPFANVLLQEWPSEPARCNLTRKENTLPLLSAFPSKESTL